MHVAGKFCERSTHRGPKLDPVDPPGRQLPSSAFVRIPFSVYSSWPLNFELLYSLGLLLDDHVVSKLIHFAFFFFMAFVLLEKHQEGEGRTHLLLSAVCCGFVMGAKYTGVFVAFSLLSLLILSAVTRRGSPIARHRAH